MARGGFRPGAGRKKGSKGKRMSQAVIAAAAATGKLPHEILLAVARGEAIQVPSADKQGKITYSIYCPSAEQMIDAAKAAAPFYAPRLMAVAAKVNAPGNPWDDLLDLVKQTPRGLPSGNARAAQASRR